ncbi:MAG TPA: penicillin-binding protein 2 [Actinomycetota bacterium]|nr:penicillin-binding protein 2 [Actinomycetota bacterium]
MTDGRAAVRLKILVFLVLAMFAALTTRLWFLQVLASEQFKDEATRNSVRIVEIPAPRGRILDASGEPLVISRHSNVLTVNRQEIGEDRERVITELSVLLDVPAAELGARLDDSTAFEFTPVPIAANVPERVIAYVEERKGDFPGVSYVEQPVRVYPLGSAAAHILGYLGEITEEKLEDPAFAGYEPGDHVGVAGIEAAYEHHLIGTPGLEKFVVNSLGDPLERIGSRDPEPGADVYLTIDADTQRLAEDALKGGIKNARGILDDTGYLKADAGAVLVMNPDTGGIEAMVSYPGFEPSLFVRGMSNREFERRFGETKGNPLLNRAIQGEYPPGSTYKPFIALSALSTPFEGEGPKNTIAQLDRSYGCPPSYIAPFDEDDPNATQYAFGNWTTANLGFMNLATALAKSCDTVFYPMGYEFWRILYPYAGEDGEQGTEDDVLREPLQDDLAKIGFGQFTNIDLPFEKDGRVPDAAWKREIHEANPTAFPYGEWVPGDFINMSIGQGDTLVTPLQLAVAYSGLMSAEGRLCVPHLLDRVVDPTTDPEPTLERRYRPQCRDRLPFTPEEIAYVRNALQGTLRPGGTAAGAFVGFPFDRVWAAGKTGTAEVDPKQDFSWFAAMVEAQGERHVVVALVEQGGHGSETAAPIARRIIEGLYGLPYSDIGYVPPTD